MAFSGRGIGVEKIAHAWAHQREGRNGIEGAAGNISYRGTNYYSYATVVAKLHPDQKVVLYSCIRYSNTTDRHLSSARSAVDDVQYPQHFYVPVVNPVSTGDGLGQDHAQNVEYFRQQRDIHMQKAATGRSRRGQYLESASMSCSLAARYAKAFGYKGELPTMPEDTEAKLAEFAVQIKEQQKRDLARRKEREAKKQVEQAERLAEWRAGVIRYGGRLQMALRISANGEAIETTRAARIPTASAIRLWPFLERAHRTGVAITCEGSEAFHLGYPFYGFADDVLHVGCHYIPYSEIELMAHELGLVKEVA